MRIASVVAREILDSRGNPTVAVSVLTSSGARGTAAVPSGASTGSHEALELRDGDARRYGGKGVRTAVANVQGEIAARLAGIDCRDQMAIDAALCELDGTPNYARLGANAVLGASLAAARAAAAGADVPLHRHLREVYLSAGGSREAGLPVPMMNLLNGGRHADFVIDVQECLVLPGQSTFAERVRCGSEIFHALGGLLRERGLLTGVGDEGGYAPKLGSNAEAFGLLVDAIAKAGYAAGSDVHVGADVAASEFYDAATQRYNFVRDGVSLSSDECVARYEEWAAKFPFATLEDGLAEDDWAGWSAMTARLGDRLELVGDDFFVTSAARLQRGIESKAANAVLIKPNQIGTLSQTLETICLAQANGYSVAVSHRSGETADTFIADLAVAVGADYIKTGSLSRSERVEKYNRLMEIEEELG
jgi:enolase